MTTLAHRRCRPLLGTLVEVAVPERHAHTADLAFAAVARVDRAMSFHREDGDLARLRRAPPGTVVPVDPETAAVLRLAERLHRRSGGLFDVTVAAVLVADGFLPCPDGIDHAGLTGGAADIEIVGDAHVRCRRPLLIDLGGIAKGHAVDLAVAALKAAGVEAALVNAGGDLRVLGDEPQTIHLRAAGGGLEGVVTLADLALASSSNLLDRRRARGRTTVPHRGRGASPVVTDEAVTVAAPTCAVADAMTKIALADRTLAAAMLTEEGGEIVDRPAGRVAA